MNTLIVGCGYLGTALGEELARRGHTVWGMRRSADGDAVLTGAGIRPLHADVTRPGWSGVLPEPVHWVVYCAAPTSGDPAGYAAVYGAGVRRVVEELLGHPVRRAVYTSSTGVYAEARGGWVTEESATAAFEEKGQWLLAAERTWLEAAQSAAWRPVVLRVSGMYGAGRGYYIRRFFEGPGLGPEEADRWINQVHRDDVVTAVICALEHAEPGAVYNVTDDEPVQLGRLFAWLEERTGRPAPAGGAPGEVRRRPGSGNKRVSNARIKTELGWRPRYPTFREGYEAELIRLKRTRPVPSDEHT
ncbi:MAG: SDR family oxidoreductase [Limisphaera sp.]